MSFDKSIILCLLFFINVPHLALFKEEVRTLDDESWSEMLEGEWMVEFFAPWCPACQQLQPLWKEFSGWSDDLNIKVGDVDVTVNPGLSGRFMITALPTIYHIKDGIFRQYRGPRDKESFISFVEEKKWQNIDPVPGWKSPHSFPMTIVSYFFKLSMVLRNMHNTMMQDYGFPQWGSYFVFGVATVIIGALLGLLFVCVIDCCTSRATGYEALKTSPNSDPRHKEKESDGEYEGEDVIKDDPAEDGDVRRRREPLED